MAGDRGNGDSDSVGGLSIDCIKPVDVRSLPSRFYRDSLPTASSLWKCDVDVRDCIEPVAGDRCNGESDSAGGVSSESSDLTAAADNPHTTGKELKRR